MGSDGRRDTNGTAGTAGTGDTGRTVQPLRGRDLVGLGGLLVGCVVVGLVVGYLLDTVAGTSPALTLAGIFLGIAGGAVGFWLRVRRFLRS